MLCCSVALFRAQRQNELFPDEIDTPHDQPARVRFQKYRGLASFRTSPWDARENLPADYARIFKFENFARTRKRVLEAEEVDESDSVAPGRYARLHIANVPLAFAGMPDIQSCRGILMRAYHLQWVIAERYCSSATTQWSPLIVYALLEHEQKMSVLNMVIRRHVSAEKKVVKAKSRLIFHVGFRRFAASPIFSQHTNGDKHKVALTSGDIIPVVKNCCTMRLQTERFLPSSEATCVATCFAPITYPPASVLVFYEDQRGTQY